MLFEAESYMELTVGSHSIAVTEFLPNPPALTSQVLGLITRSTTTPPGSHVLIIYQML